VWYTGGGGREEMGFGRFLKKGKKQSRKGIIVISGPNYTKLIGEDI